MFVKIIYIFVFSIKVTNEKIVLKWDSHKREDSFFRADISPENRISFGMLKLKISTWGLKSVLTKLAMVLLTFQGLNQL